MVLLSFSILDKCNKKTYINKINISNIYNQEEDEYMIYFYKNDCPYCDDVYDTIKSYNKFQKKNKSMRLYTCNVSNEENSLIKREYLLDDGEGNDGKYHITGVKDCNDLYIAGVPCIIIVRIIEEEKTSFYQSVGRTKVKEYLNELMEEIKAA